MLFANNCNTTLNGGITAVATSMVVTSATGFPVPTGSQYFYCTLADAATQTTIEIVKVTAVSGTTFTIVRGQDGTSGTIFASGAVVSLRLVRANLNDFPKLDEVNTFTFAPTFNTALAVSSGGTGLTTLTAGYIPYGNGTSAFNSSSKLYFDGTSLGLNVVPKAWSVSALQVGGFASLSTSNSGYANLMFAAYESPGDTYKYMTTGDVPTRYGQISGYHVWYNAPSGTAGNNITWNTVMELFPSGGVSIGNTTDPGAGNLSVTGYIFTGISGQTGNTGSGRIVSNTTGSLNCFVGQYSGTGGAAVGLELNYNASTSTGYMAYFRYNGAAKGSITCDGTTTLYNSISDYRLKDNISPMTGALDTVNLLKPVTYTWKDSNKPGQGFIADQLQSVMPDAVVGKKDAVDEKGNPLYQAIDTSVLVATLVSAIQELNNKFDAYVASHP